MAAPSRFTCEDVFQRLDDYLDRALTPEEVRMVQEHLEICGVCAGEYRFEGTLLAGLRDKLARIDLPEGLAARLHARIREAALNNRP